MNNLSYAFIFARGGSKGLPRKNVKKLLDKPLIQYSIDLALSIGIFKEVFVSTEDPEISNISKSLGATVIDRPAKLAADNSPEWLSWRHAITWVKKNRGDFDIFVSLPTTSPLRSKDDIINATQKLTDSSADVCIAITPSSRSPYFNMVTKSQDCLNIVLNTENKISRRQDAPQVFDVTTLVYAASPEFILSEDGLFSGKVTSIEVPKDRAVDIDDIYDFLLAETILMSQANEKP